MTPARGVRMARWGKNEILTDPGQRVRETEPGLCEPLGLQSAGGGEERAGLPSP